MMTKRVMIIVCLLLTIVQADQFRYLGIGGTGNITQGTSWANRWGSADTALRYLVDSVLTTGFCLFVEDSVYSITQSYDASAKDSIKFIIGVKKGTTHEGNNVVWRDYSYDSVDMPQINAGVGYAVTLGDSTDFENFITYGETTTPFIFGSEEEVVNCIFKNTSSNAFRNCISVATGRVTLCDFRGIGRGLSGGTGTLYVTSCRFFGFDDASNGSGIVYSTGAKVVRNCIFYMCNVGISSGSAVGPRVDGCIFYYNTIGFSGTTTRRFIAANNILYTCGTGFKITTPNKTNKCYATLSYGCTATYDGIDSAGIGADRFRRIGTPTFVDVSANNFRPSDGSAAIDSGMGTK